MPQMQAGPSRMTVTGVGTTEGASAVQGTLCGSSGYRFSPVEVGALSACHRRRARTSLRLAVPPQATIGTRRQAWALCQWGRGRRPGWQLLYRLQCQGDPEALQHSCSLLLFCTREVRGTRGPSTWMAVRCHSAAPAAINPSAGPTILSRSTLYCPTRTPVLPHSRVWLLVRAPPPLPKRARALTGAERGAAGQRAGSLVGGALRLPHLLLCVAKGHKECGACWWEWVRWGRQQHQAADEEGAEGGRRLAAHGGGGAASAPRSSAPACRAATASHAKSWPLHAVLPLPAMHSRRPCGTAADPCCRWP
jgi:hypothetical protein